MPRIWQEPTVHSSKRYFCMVDPSKRQTGKNAPAIMYPDLQSFIVPVPQCPKLPVPTPVEKDLPSSEESSKSDEEKDIVDPGFRGAAEERFPYSPTKKTSMT